MRRALLAAVLAVLLGPATARAGQIVTFQVFEMGEYEAVYSAPQRAGFFNERVPAGQRPAPLSATVDVEGVTVGVGANGPTREATIRQSSPPTPVGSDGDLMYHWDIFTQQRLFPSGRFANGAAVQTSVKIFYSDLYDTPLDSRTTITRVFANDVAFTPLTIAPGVGSDSVPPGAAVGILPNTGSSDLSYGNPAATIDYGDGTAPEALEVRKDPDRPGYDLYTTKRHVFTERFPKPAVVRIYADQLIYQPPVARTGTVGIDLRPPVLTLSDLTVDAGTADRVTRQIDLTLSDRLSRPLEVDFTPLVYDEEDGPTEGPARSREFALDTRTLTIPAGSTRAQLPIVIKGTTEPDLTRVLRVRAEGAGAVQIVGASTTQPESRVTILNTRPLPTIDGFDTTVDGVNPYTGSNGGFALHVPGRSERWPYCFTADDRQPKIEDLYWDSGSASKCVRFDTGEAPLPVFTLSGPSRRPLQVVFQECYGEFYCKTRREAGAPDVPEAGLRGLPSELGHNRSFVERYPDLVRYSDTRVGITGLQRQWYGSAPNPNQRHWGFAHTLSPRRATVFGDTTFDTKWDKTKWQAPSDPGYQSRPMITPPMYAGSATQHMGYKVALAVPGTPTVSQAYGYPEGQYPVGPVFATSDRRVATETKYTYFKVYNPLQSEKRPSTGSAASPANVAAENAFNAGRCFFNRELSDERSSKSILVQLIRKDDCFDAVAGGVFKSDEAVSVNGVVLTPVAGTQIEVNTNVNTIKTSPGGGATVSFPSRNSLLSNPPTIAGEKKIDWKPLESAAQSVGGILDGKGFYGLPMVKGANVGITFTDRGATVPITVGLPFIPGDVSKMLVLAITPERGVALSELHIDLPQIPLYFVKILPSKISLVNGEWSASTGILIPGAKVPDGYSAEGKDGIGKGISGSFRIGADGRLKDLTLDAIFDPGYPLGATGVSLRSIGGGFRTVDRKDAEGRDTSYLHLDANVGLAAGPNNIIGLNGKVEFDADDPWYLRASGRASVSGVPLAAATIAYTNGQSLTLDGVFDANLANFLLVNLNVYGGIFFAPLEFYAGGYGEIQIRLTDIWTAKVSGGVLLSSAVVAGCASAGPIGAGGVYNWRTKATETWFGCTNEDLKSRSGLVNKIPDATKVKAQASRRAVPTSTVTVQDGLPNVLFAFDGGKRGVPQVDIDGPGGLRFSARGDDHTIITDDTFVYSDLTKNRLYVAFGSPKGGKYTITQQDDSVPVTKVWSADGVDEPSMDATVSGSGAKRTISYEADPVDGQTYTFLETGGGVTNTIRRDVEGHRGSFTFTPTIGTASDRKVEVVVNRGGYPRAQLKVAEFTGPKIRRLPAPRKLRLRRRGKSVIARWERVRGATAYHVYLTTLGGQRLFFESRKPRIRLEAPGLEIDEGSVTVSPIDVNSTTGRSASRRLPR